MNLPIHSRRDIGSSKKACSFVQWEQCLYFPYPPCVPSKLRVDCMRKRPQARISALDATLVWWIEHTLFSPAGLRTASSFSQQTLCSKSGRGLPVHYEIANLAISFTLELTPIFLKFTVHAMYNSQLMADSQVPSHYMLTARWQMGQGQHSQLGFPFRCLLLEKSRSQTIANPIIPCFHLLFDSQSSLFSAQVHRWSLWLALGCYQYLVHTIGPPIIRQENVASRVYLGTIVLAWPRKRHLILHGFS